MKIIHEDCDPKLAKDKKLPYTAYLICYLKDNTGALHHDIAVAGTQVELFDHYYDKYRKGFQWLKQTEGRVNPVVWKTKQEELATPPKKKRK